MTETKLKPDTSNQPWRDVLPVHPAAELFPPLSASELEVLAEDIKAHGLITKPVLWSSPDPDDKYEALIDGRNRLDALALAGLLGVDENNRLTIKRNGETRQIFYQYAKPILTI